ncbi:MAG: hypothetical protein MRY64_03400 [Hyphomonadaceae bacterium]|nr:hypothetical protein [Hyphomonadaceae bacterium]
MNRFSLAAAAAASSCVWPLGQVALAEEAYVIPDSTVIGQNYGYPTGTPVHGETLPGSIDLVVEATTFLKTIERGDLDGFELGPTDSENFLGFIAPLRARLRVHDRITFEAGAIFAENMGDNDTMDPIIPLARVAVEPVDDVYLIAGTLLPTHWSHQALFDDVNKFRETSEQGFQVRADLPFLKQDTWVNWRLRDGNVHSDEMEVGSTTQIRLFDDILRLDGQVHWVNIAGPGSEFDLIESNIAGLLGASVGVSAPFGFDIIEDARIGAAALQSSDDTRIINTEDGSGWETTATLDLRTSNDTFVRIKASQFEGDGLIARRGDLLYTQDDYTQIGATGIWQLGSGLRIEAGGGVQDANGSNNWTAKVNLTWGGSFFGDILSF